jgi:hypothetical protein
MCSSNDVREIKIRRMRWGKRKYIDLWIKDLSENESKGREYLVDLYGRWEDYIKTCILKSVASQSMSYKTSSIVSTSFGDSS